MKLLRFLTPEDKPACGRLLPDADLVEILHGPSLLDPPAPTGQTIHLALITSFLPPVDPPNILAIGQNYHEHAREMGASVPDEPKLFIKATTCLNHHLGPIRIPNAAPDAIDFEAELVIVIGRTARNVSQADAPDYILGYTAGNDITARDCQKHDGQWARAKSFDSFGPVGPIIDTQINPDNLPIRSLLNGQTMQNSNTADMIFSPAFIVSYLSRMMTLLPATLIFTGTPPGIGLARKPAVFLHPGDTITIEIEGLTQLTNPIA